VRDAVENETEGQTETRRPMNKKTVFISYSHDSDDHREKVLALSERLRTDGVETLLDQDVNGSPRRGWPRWMLDQLDAADFVLLVCTPTYYRRYRGHEQPGKGKGADWERALITQEIYDSRSGALKFVPVFLSAAIEGCVPEPLRAVTHYALASDGAYQRLCDVLLGQAGVEPRPDGTLKSKARRKASAPAAIEPARPVRRSQPIAPQRFVDEKVRQAAIALNQARVDKSLSMKTLMGTLDRLFERDTFRGEPSVGLCPTQEWDYRLHAALQTHRLMQQHESFVEIEARSSWQDYRELTAEVARYCQRMAAYLFEPAVGLAELRALVGTDEFVKLIHEKKKWFEGGVGSAICREIDPHLESSIRRMKVLHDDFVGTAARAAVKPVSPPGNLPQVQTQNRLEPTMPIQATKTTILFMGASPDGVTKLALDKEYRAIREKVRASDFPKALELKTEWAVRPLDLLQYLNEYRPHVVHFSGHGSESNELILNDESDQPKPVSVAALRALFKTLKDNIRLVVLNACYSRPQAKAIVEIIDCAVGMKRAIGDQAAIVFAASFYQALGFGRSVQDAFNLGCTALLLQGIAEENTPELLVKKGVDAATVFLVGSAANPT
jgi:hypothetical protein